MDISNFNYAINNITGEYEILYLRDDETIYYLYVVDEIEGQYGPQLLAVVDGMETIYALPTIKAFVQGLVPKNFYKIAYEGEVFFDNGYTRHDYRIQHISEDEYLKKAKDNFDEYKKY